MPPDTVVDRSTDCPTSSVVRETVKVGVASAGETVRVTVPERTVIPLESVIEAATE